MRMDCDVRPMRGLAVCRTRRRSRRRLVRNDKRDELVHARRRRDGYSEQDGRRVREFPLYWFGRRERKHVYGGNKRRIP